MTLLILRYFYTADIAKSDKFNPCIKPALSGSLAVPAIPGKRPYKKSSSGFVPSTDSHCTNCGLCAEKCPAQAISKDNGKVTDKSKCISCMRCVSICPVHARSLNKVTVSVVASAIKKACSVQKSNELFL